MTEEDEDIMKIDRLQLINASARHDLLSANQQLLDFQLNRFVNKKKRTLRKAVSSKPERLKGYPVGNHLHVSEIHEEQEQEEAGTTFKRHPPNNNHTEHEGTAQVERLRFEGDRVPVFGAHLRTETAGTNTISDLLGETSVDQVNES